MSKSKNLNLGRFCIHEEDLSNEARLQAIKDMVDEEKSNMHKGKKNQKTYVPKTLCLLNPKTFKERFGDNED